MNEAQLIALLTENIAFGLRHKHYERTIEVRNFTYSTTTGKEQEKQVQRYRRYEDDDLKEQRIRLYNSPTQGVIASLRNHFQNLATLEGIRETWEPDGTDALTRLKADYYNFLPGENLNDYLNRILEHYNATDPNAWIVFERYDTRNEEGRIIGDVGVWAWIVPAIDALNFETSHGRLQWIIFRTMTMERITKDGAAYVKMLENFYLYAPGVVIRAREVGEKTEQEDGETMVGIETYIGGQPEMPANGYAAPVYVGAPKVRNFYFRTIQTGTTEVPAIVTGAYMDETTGQETRVGWFQAGEALINDMIKLKSALDVTLTVHTYPRRWEFTKPCKFTSLDGECVGGWINGMQDSDHRCPACGGSGKAPNFTTDQAVLQLILPDDPALITELSKLSFTEPIDISLPELLQSLLDKKEAQFIRAVFMSDPHQKPDGAGNMTAFEVAKLHEGVEKKLKVFCRHYSRVWELAYRIGMQYREIPYTSVDHSFPEDLQIDTLDELIQRFGLAKEKGVGYEVLAAIRKRIQQKTYEGSPDMQKQIDARYKWLPFDDKSETETAMILASRSALDDTRVLWENHREIFREIEQENPLFADMAYQKQKDIVLNKVQEVKERIVLIDETPQEMEPAMPGDNPDNNMQSDETGKPMFTGASGTESGILEFNK